MSYNNHRLKNCEESIESFREYYDWVSRHPEQSINIANRFYWEEGGAAWMAPTERVTEMSEGITAAQPLNSRVFLSVLLSLPAEYRNGRLFQRKMTEYLFPETNGFGYSVDKKYYDMPYYFPYHLFSINSVILLYGAGKAGQVSLKRVKRDDFITVAAILDERADELVEIDGVPVVLPEKYKDYSFDYIFIAIRDATIAWQVKRNLINIGIEEDKIKYTQPLLFCTEEG